MAPLNAKEHGKSNGNWGYVKEVCPSFVRCLVGGGCVLHNAHKRNQKFHTLSFGV